MKLRAWLEHTRTTQTELAGSLGVSVATVSRWVNGEQSPRIEQAIAMEKISGGDVAVEEWAADSAARVG